MKRILKIVRKIVVISIVTILLLAGLAIALSSIYEDEVKAYVISKIDDKFSADINVDKIELNFWRKFPMASLRFQNISIKDSHLKENPPIFMARDLYLQFDIYDLVNHKYILRKAEAKGGKIDLLIYKSGKNNFDLFKENSDTSDFFFSMEDFKLVDIDFSYENQSNLQSYNIAIEELKLPFQMTAEGFECGVKGEFSISSYRSEGVEIIKQRRLKINAGLNYNNNQQKLVFSQSSFNVEGVELSLKGSFLIADNITANLQIEAQEVDLNLLKPLLPQSVALILDEYSVLGILNFKASLIGELGGKSMPAIDAYFEMKKASFSSSEKALNLKNVSFDGSFSNGNGRTLESSVLRINSFTGEIDSEKFSGTGIIRNFKNAQLSANITSTINMAALKKIAHLDALDVFDGNMAAQVKISFAFSHFLENAKLINYDYKGKIKFTNAKIKLKTQKVEYSKIYGDVSFNKSQVSTGLSLVVLGTKMKLNANVSNYLNLVFPINNLPYNVRADLVGDNITYDNLMKIIEIESDGQASNPWIANLAFKVNKFSWDDAEFSNFKGIFSYRDNQWSLGNCSAGFNGGFLSGNIHFKPINQNSEFTFRGNYQQLKIKDVFVAFHNFDQSTLTSNNISGDATGSFSGKMIFDAQSNLIPSSLQFQSNITIENGRLLGVKELNALSDYTKIDDFSDIKFSTLSNIITIVNQKIIIPKMHISSNKIDMDVFGNHNFENEYDYHFEILLSDILGRKIQKTQENEFGIIEDDGYGKTKIFLNLYGKGEEFTIKYDKKEASNKIKEDVKQEGTELKNVIKEEFINAHRDSLRQAKKAAKEAEKQKLLDQENGKFIIEWDEGDTTDDNF